jgi:hypothetical protein
MKPRRTRCRGGGSYCRCGRDENVYKILIGKFEGHQLEELGVEGRIILEWILKK